VAVEPRNASVMVSPGVMPFTRKYHQHGHPRTGSPPGMKLIRRAFWSIVTPVTDAPSKFDSTARGSAEKSDALQLNKTASNSAILYDICIFSQFPGLQREHHCCAKCFSHRVKRAGVKEFDASSVSLVTRAFTSVLPPIETMPRKAGCPYSCRCRRLIC